MNILEASLVAGIHHAHVCGGRGRCSTCRIRVDYSKKQLEPPNHNERKVLRKIGAPSNIRLACQAYPRNDLNVSPLLPPDTDFNETLEEKKYVHGTCLLYTSDAADE